MQTDFGKWKDQDEQEEEEAAPEEAPQGVSSPHRRHLVSISNPLSTFDSHRVWEVWEAWEVWEVWAVEGPEEWISPR